MLSRSRRCLKVLPLAFLVLFSTLTLVALTPARADTILTSGRVWGSGIAVDSAGNVAVIGSTSAFGNGQSLAVLLKYNPSGKLLCFRTFGGSSPLDTLGYGIAFDVSNNMYVTGPTQTFGGEDFDVFLQKYDASCNLLYTMQWGGAGNDIPRGIAVDSQDNVYIAGYTDSFGAGLFDVFLLKYASAGEFQFSRIWGGPKNDYASGVAVDGVGNVYVGGSTGSFGASESDVFLLKYDSSGTQLFEETWGGPQNDYSSGIAVDSAGDLYLTGSTYSEGVTSGIASVFLLKYDPSGSLLFQKTRGGTQNDYGSGVAVDSAGNVYVTGYTYSSSAVLGVPRVFLLKYDSSGNLLFENTWGGLRGDYGYGVAVDGSGNTYVSGYTYSFGPNSQGANVFLLKYDPSGNLLFQKTYGGGIPDP
jgi:hypothetical protein